MDHNQGKQFPPEKAGWNYQNSQQYDPSRYATTPQEPPPEGTLVLVDESGQQVGALGEHINVAGVTPGSSEPVEIDLSRTDGVVTYNVRPIREYRDRPQLKRSYTTPEDYYLRPIPDYKQNTLGRASTFSTCSSNSYNVHGRPHSVYGYPQKVRPIDADYLRDAQDPAYAKSRLVGTAATASRAIVTGASLVAKAMEAGAKTFVEKTKPVNTPMTFQPTTHNYVRQIHNYSSTGVKIASKTVGTVTTHAQNLGAKLAGKGEGYERSRSPGLINKGLMAFGTLADGIDYASKLILTSTSHATTTMVGHRYGSEAEELARGLTGVVKNVGLVYVDAAGVSRRAIVKSVAKGMVVGRVKGGGEVIFEGNNTSQAFMTEPGVSISAPGTPLPSYPGAPPSPGQHYQNYSTPPQFGSGRTSPLPPHQQGQFAPPQQYSNSAPTPGPFKY